MSRERFPPSSRFEEGVKRVRTCRKAAVVGTLLTLAAVRALEGGVKIVRTCRKTAGVGALSTRSAEGALATRAAVRCAL